MHWDGCAIFRVAWSGMFSCCLVLVGQALFIPSPCEGVPVRFDLAAAQMDRQPLAGSG
jgi:hypothetical protein